MRDVMSYLHALYGFLMPLRTTTIFSQQNMIRSLIRHGQHIVMICSEDPLIISRCLICEKKSITEDKSHAALHIR